MFGRFSHLGLAVAAVLLTFCVEGAANEVDFAKDVLPILETHCIGCHTEDDPEGGFVMETHAGLLKGGESGTAITEGVPSSSRMLLMATKQLKPFMPPDGEEGPSEAELEVLAKWIEQGANGPSGDLPIKRSLRTPKIKPAPVAAPITSIARSADGQQIARARFGEIEILVGEQTIKIEDEDLGKVNALTFSEDGTRLLAASGLTGGYGRAVIYATDSGALVKELVGHRDILYAAEFSPDGTLVATAGYDREIWLWDLTSGEPIRELKGHNGAIFDLSFSPDGKVLVSACADETAKVWNVSTGARLDTLSQPEGEVFAVAVTPDGKYIVAGSGDNRLRTWRLVSKDKPSINPLVATRFVDETPIVSLAISPNGTAVIAMAESGNLKLVRAADWSPVAALEPLGESGTDMFFSADGASVVCSMMNGEMVTRSVPAIESQRTIATASLNPTYMDFGEATHVEESKSHEAAAAKPWAKSGDVIEVGRNVRIKGSIDREGQADLYRWPAHAGEVWAIDANAAKSSRIDPIVRILDARGRPVLRTRLQAVRDSYFTFRGKNSTQINDFRIFNWQEMKLGEYLYSAGEVTRLMMHPRGPDSGFNVYPGEGNRWTYFGSSGTTHALGEPAYIVRPLDPGETPLANGLPVFDVVYENDDDSMGRHGKNSRLIFTAPANGLYTVSIEDTRGEGGASYGYELAIRPAVPSFVARVNPLTRPLRPATGREFKVFVDREDGFNGEVTYEISGLPDRLTSNFPLVIEAGQKTAMAMIWASPNEKGWKDEIEPTLTAWAMINGRRVERSVGSAGKLKFDAKPVSATPMIKPIKSEVAAYEHWTLRVRRGETAMARVAIQRKEGFKNEVSFGKELAGRNARQGVYVDNIGLNGLLIVAGASERDFFITADETAIPGKRLFHLTANNDGGVTSQPITIEVLP